MKNIILISIVTVISAYIVLSCSRKNSRTVPSETDISKSLRSHNDSMSAGMLQPIGHAMAKMNEIEMTGDFDIDFANSMIEHHQAAIDMSKAEIFHGVSERIKSMAQNIVNVQNVEIDQLQLFVKNYQRKETTKPEANGVLNTMMNDMTSKIGSITMTGNSDSDFVRLMIPHHESAVKMAEAELVYGKEEALKKMAQQMIADQRSEIVEFNAWLSNQH